MALTFMNRMPFAVWVAVLVAVVALLIAAGIVFQKPGPGERVSSQGNAHLASVDAPHDAYNSAPPTSGPHVNSKAPWGIHDVQIPDELQVHNLEDGGVIIHYGPARIDDATRKALETVVNSYPDKVILEPYAEMNAPIVLTAWQRRLGLEILDEAAIREFIRAYRGVDHHAPGV